MAGYYEVEACWVNGLRGWRTKNAKYEIAYINEEGAADYATVIRNQYYLPASGVSGEYVSLGTFYFNAGTGGSVKITDDGADTKIIIADAVRFTLIDPSAIPTSIIADTEEASLLGPWLERSRNWLWGTYYGYSYLQASTTDGSVDEAEWRPYLPVTGLYNISGYWPDGVSWWRADSATYIIADALGSDENVTVDIDSQSGEWIPIGSGAFVQGQIGSVTIIDDDDGSDRDNDSVIVADAVQFEMDCAVVVAPENGYSSTVNIGITKNVTPPPGTPSEIDYTVNTQYTATLIGEGCVGQAPSWIWTSDNTSIATVDSTGLVSGVSEGRANITAQADVEGKLIAGVNEVAVMSLLVDKDWLDLQTDPNLIVVHVFGDPSATPTPPTTTIDGAITFNIYDLNEIAQTQCSEGSTQYGDDTKFVIKDEARLEAALGAIGISRDSIIVAYDSSPGAFGRGDLATYLLWIMDMLGHDITKLHLFNGQFRQWFLDDNPLGSPVTLPDVTYDPGNLQAFNSSLNTTGCFIKQHMTNPDYVWLATIPDTTAFPEFTQHHIPCATQINFEVNHMVPSGPATPAPVPAGDDWRLKDPVTLYSIYAAKDVTHEKYISTY